MIIHFYSFSVSTQDQSSADLSSHERYKCDFGVGILKEYHAVMTLS